MRWTPGGVSGYIEDRRDSSGGGGGGFGGGGIPFGIGGLLVLLVLSFVFKRDLISPFLNSGAGDSSCCQSIVPSILARNAAEAKEVQFVSFVLDDTLADWDKIIPNYHHAKLVLFRNEIQSPCGQAGTATGPFYCPGDEKVYLDLGFFDELRTRFGASGEFAQAYVIAHEIGHHVQKILGIEKNSPRAAAARSAIRQCAFGSPRAAGRLLRGRVGQFHRAAQLDRSERCRVRNQCRSRGWRRSFAETGHGPRDA